MIKPIKFTLILLLMFFAGNYVYGSTQSQDNIQSEIKQGDSYFQSGNLRKAKRFYKKALRNNKNNQFPKQAAAALWKLGKVSLAGNDLDAAEDNYQQALAIAKKNNLTNLVDSINSNLNELNNQKRIQQKYVQLNSLSRSEAIDSIEKNQEDNAAFLARIKHLSKQKQLEQLRVRLKQNELTQKETQIALLNQINQTKQLQIEEKTNDLEVNNALLMKKDAENAKQKFIIGFSIGVLILVVALMLYVYRGYIQRKRHNEVLKNINKVISVKNKEITDSIHYAKRIQEATLSASNKNRSALAENFIMYEPKDIVSGDFYWIRSIGNKVVWAVVDCTGHGVPGAFMSMIGNRLLNEIIIERKILQPNQILDELKTKIIQSLNQEGHFDDSKDGMDISICILDKKTNLIDFAGAFNSVYIIKKDIAKSRKITDEKNYRPFENDLIEIKANRFSVGYNPYVNEPFTNHQFHAEKDDMVYLFSDGFADQFGGEKGKKYTYKRFKNTLIDIHKLPVEEQKEELETIFSDWKSKTEQIDDVCIMGVRI